MRLMIVMMVAALVFPRLAKAETKGNPDQPTTAPALRLAGSRMPTERAVESSKLIVVARALGYGRGYSPISGLNAQHVDFLIRITQFMKGQFPDNQLKVTFTVQNRFPADGTGESVTTSGNAYIYFFPNTEWPEFGLWAKKILPATKANVEEVQRLIDAGAEDIAGDE